MGQQKTIANPESSTQLLSALGVSDFNGIEDLEKIFLLLEPLTSLTPQQEKYKETLAFALCIAYRDGNKDGDPGWAPDERKADFYLAKILTTVSPENIVDNTLFWFAWLTTVRLALLRLLREYWTLNSIDPTKYAFNFRNFQFSYLPELVVCVYKLFTHSFRPKTIEDSWHTNRFEKKRFWQTLCDRKFFGTLSNAFVWLLVNIIGYYVVPWASALINLAGFAFDIAHDFYIANQELKEYKGLEEKKHYPKHLLGTQNETNTPLGKKIKELTFTRNYVTLVAIALFIGMLLFYAPAFIPAAHAYFSASTGWYAVTTTLALKNLEPLKDIIRMVGATFIIIFAVGWNFLKGKLKNLWDKDFYKKSWKFLKNNKIESMLPIVFFAGAITLSFLSTLPIIPLYALMLCPPIIVFGLVKAISSLWQRLSQSRYVLSASEGESIEINNYYTHFLQY